MCGGHLTKVLHPVAIHFKGSGFYTTDYGRGSGKRSGRRDRQANDGDDAAGSASKASGDGKTDTGKAEGGKAGTTAGEGRGGTAAAPAAGKGGRPTGRGVMAAPDDELAAGRTLVDQATSERFARKARTNLRSLVSDDSKRLPSLSVVADDIRLELERHGEVAILYVGLKRYGRLERVFGWRIISDMLDACSSILRRWSGSTLRKLDVLADFTLTDDAFIVLLSPPRRAKEIVATT